MKKEEIRKKSEQELEQEVARATASHQRLTFGHSISPLDNPLQIREERRHIARLKTELNSRRKQVQ